jgi:hypothetical protein
MRTFRSEREAKEYLIQRILDQANRVREPLTDLERKMLYFSETGWTLTGIEEVNREFEARCDVPAYERKILALATSARADDELLGVDAVADWDAAVDRLSGGDHYLLVLMNPALVPPAPVKPKGGLRRLLLTAGAIAVGCVVLFVLVEVVFRRG